MLRSPIGQGVFCRLVLLFNSGALGFYWAGLRACCGVGLGMSGLDSDVNVGVKRNVLPFSRHPLGGLQGLRQERERRRERCNVLQCSRLMLQLIRMVGSM